MGDESFFRHLTEQLQERGRLALATVVEVKGQGPSRIGRRFLIFEDGTFSGTIGGGPFEALVVADAGALFREEDPGRLIKCGTISSSAKSSPGWSAKRPT